MKNILILCTISLFFITTGCEKAINDIVDAIIDCSTEYFFMTISSDADADDSKLIHFTFDYSNSSSDYTLDNTINWDFGDGSPTETSQGLMINHTYVNAGPYTVIGYYTLRKGVGSCQSSKQEDIEVN
jgi:hypothetical protein